MILFWMSESFRGPRIDQYDCFICCFLYNKRKNKLVVVKIEELKSGANEGNQGTLHQRLPSSFQGFLSYTLL